MWSVQVYKDLASVEAIWKSLYDATPNTEPFSTWEYATLWWKHFGEGQTPHIIVAQHPFDAERKVLMPLMRQGTQLRWLCTPGPDNVELLYTDAQDIPDALKAIASHLKRQGWAKLSLTYLPKDQAEMITEQFSQFPHRIVEEAGSPYLMIEGRTWEDYLKTLSHSRRGDMKAVRRKIEKSGNTVRIEYITDPVRMKEAFPIMQQLTYAGTIADKHDLVRGKQGDMLLDLSCEYAARGWITMVILYFNETPAAYAMYYTMKGVTGYWRAAYDDKFNEFSLGKLLLFNILEASFNRGDSKFDFMHGVMPYKLQWTQDIKPLVYVVMDRSALVSRVATQFKALRATMFSVFTR